LTWAGGRFNFVGGTVTGTVYVFNGALDVAATAGSATILAAGASTLIANRAPQVTVWVQGSSLYSHATLTTAESAYNAGTILLQSVDQNWNSVLTTPETGFLNDTSGIIQAKTGTGGPRQVSGYLINKGLVDGTDFNLDITGTYESAGGQVSGNAR